MRFDVVRGGVGRGGVWWCDVVRGGVWYEGRCVV